MRNIVHKARAAAIAVALLAPMLLALNAHAGKLQAQARWGGMDLPFSCATVREHRAEIEAMSPARRRFWIETFRISRKMQRQARACLR